MDRLPHNTTTDLRLILLHHLLDHTAAMLLVSRRHIPMASSIDHLHHRVYCSHLSHTLPRQVHTTPAHHNKLSSRLHRPAQDSRTTEVDLVQVVIAVHLRLTNRTMSANLDLVDHHLILSNIRTISTHRYLINLDLLNQVLG